MLRLRMCDPDRERYGGPEWLTFDNAKLRDTPCDELSAIEARTGIVLAEAVDNPAAAGAMRLWLWLALDQADVHVDWDEFTPRTLRVQVGDGDPPDQGPTAATEPSQPSDPPEPPSTAPSRSSSPS